MGPLSQVMGMLPGMGAMANRAEVQAALDGDVVGRFEAIILSMTPGERANPDVLNGSRRRRVARGSGTSVQEVNQLLNQFRQARTGHADGQFRPHARRSAQPAQECKARDH